MTGTEKLDSQKLHKNLDSFHLQFLDRQIPICFIDTGKRDHFSAYRISYLYFYVVLFPPRSHKLCFFLGVKHSDQMCLHGTKKDLKFQND